MTGRVTEGQQLYLNEDYERALPKLKEELELARQDENSGVEPDINDPRVYKVLIASLDGDLPSPFHGQPGVLDFAQEMITERAAEGVALALLAALQKSSNDGVQALAGILRDVLKQDSIQTWHTHGLEPYKAASEDLNDQHRFFAQFGLFLLTINQRVYIPIDGLSEALSLLDVSKQGFDPDTPDYARTQLNEANTRQKLAERGENPVDNLTTAIELYQSARTTFDTDTPSHARTQVNEANARQRLAERGENPVDNLTTAIDLHQSARTTFDPDTPDYASTQMNEATARTELAERGKNPVDNLATAIDLYQSARATFDPDTHNHAATQMNEANARRELAERGRNPVDNLTTAINLHQSARTTFEPNTSDHASAQVNEANARQELAERGRNPVDNLTTAIDLYDSARTTFDPDTPKYALMQMNEANARQELAEQGRNPVDNLTTAIDLYDSARTTFDPDTPKYALMQMNEANARAKLAERGRNPIDNLTTGINLHQSARTTFDPDTPDYASTQMNEATARTELAERGKNPVDNLATAIDLYQSARATFDPDTPKYALMQMNEANARRQLAERGENLEVHLAEAEILYTEARQVFDRTFDYASLFQVTGNQANLYVSTGELENAYESSTRAIETIEEMRKTVQEGGNREDFFDKYIDIYRSTVSLALELDKPQDAFEYAERAKSRLFLDKLADTQPTGDIPDDLAEEAKQLKEEIANLRRDLDSNRRGVRGFADTVSAAGEPVSRAIQSPESESTHTPQAQVGGQQRSVSLKLSQMGEEIKQANDLQRAKQELERVQAEMKEEDPEAFTLRSVDVASLEEVQAELGSDEQLLEYFLTEDELVIFLIDEHTLTTEIVSIDESEPVELLASVVGEYRTLVEAGPESDISQWQALGRDLYELVIEPVENKLTVETLVIVPHGGLHVVPLAALYDGERYLAEQYQLRVLANASTLRFLDKAADGSVEDALVVGDPRDKPDDPDLVHARKEAQTVAELYNSKALIGPEAIKKDVEKGLERADLAHLACHAEYDRESPGYSRIFLAETVLSLEELFELDVTGELVSLAACETALGEVSRGDEVQSFARGFQYAGASSVIGTLWQVADSLTPAFFREFYTAEGRYAERLQQAQLSFINADDSRAHPYFWSGFHLYGSH